MARPGYRPHSRNFLDFFGRWRSPIRNVEGLWSGCVPVALIDRFRDDEEGSYFGMTMSTPGAVGEFSACAIGSSDADLEVHAIDHRRATSIYLTAVDVHLFTPIAPYNPVLNPNPAGFFLPGLLTDKSFTFGSARGVAGTNPALPAVFGPFMYKTRARDFTTGVELDGKNIQYFDPPLRIYRNVTLALQNLTAGTFPLECEIFYTERRRVSE